MSKIITVFTDDFLDFSGYMCQWIGNMNCSEEVTFQCQGSGIIDCTGTCPGDEETLETMMKMIQDPEMAEKFPMIAAMQNKTAEAKGGNNSKFLQMLRGCGFEKLIALMSLASGGFGGGEESEITQVDESALSGFGGDYDYDYYEDYYDEEVEEVKEEPIIEKEAETKQKDVVLPDRKVSASRQKLRGKISKSTVFFAAEEHELHRRNKY